MNFPKNNFVNSVFEYYSDKYPSSETVLLRFNDFGIRVNSNSKLLSDYLKRYFKIFVVDRLAKIDRQLTAFQAPTPYYEFELSVKKPEPGKTKLKEAFYDFGDRRRLIKKLTTGLLCFLNPNHHFAIGEVEENSNQIINFVNNCFMENALNQNGILSHSSAVASGGKGLAMSGFSGRGKSTLCLHLLKQGVKYISNDRIVLYRDGDKASTLGIPKLPRVNPGTLLNNPALQGILNQEDEKEYSTMSFEELWEVEDKYDVLLQETFGKDSIQLKTPLNYFIILNWEKNGGDISFNEVQLSEKPQLIDTFIKREGLFCFIEQQYSDDELKEKYIEFLEPVTMFEIKGGVDFDKARDFCHDLLG